MYLKDFLKISNLENKGILKEDAFYIIFIHNISVAYYIIDIGYTLLNFSYIKLIFYVIVI